MVHPVRLTVVAFATAAILASTPGGGVAQTCQAPPGTSAVEQYCESVPTADSNDTTPQAERQRASDPSASLDPSTRSELANAGEDGAAVAQFAGSAEAETGTSAPKLDRDNRADTANASGNAYEDDETSVNPLRAVAASISNGATVGDGFGWLMLACTVVIAGTAWLRHRGRTRS